MFVLLYGAAGHTGQFIAAELVRRGLRPLLAGRDQGRLEQLAARIGGGAEIATCPVDDHARLTALATKSVAILNAAGPFSDTAPQLIEAAIRAHRPYFDVSGEPFVVRDLFARFDAPAREAGVLVAPGFGFFGALGDLLASAAMGDWHHADAIDLACALDSWKPTRGSRLAGERRAGRRLVWANDRLEERSALDKPQGGRWTFAAPFGDVETVGEFSTVDVVTMSRHLRFERLSTWINTAPLADLRNDTGEGPEPVDELGRSSQRFLLEAVVSKDGEQRRASASGQDIYAVTAPLLVEALTWTLSGRTGNVGALGAGQFLDASAFLQALASSDILIVKERDI